VLLFSLMVTTYYLARHGLYTALERLLSKRCSNAYDLLARLVTLAGLLAPWMTNSAVVLFMTPVAARLVRKYSLPPPPFMVALASSANIGSAGTPVGNSHIVLIMLSTGLLFRDYVKYMLLLAVGGLLLNMFVVYAVYYRGFHDHASGLFRLYGRAGSAGFSADDASPPMHPTASAAGPGAVGSRGSGTAEDATLLTALEDDLEALRGMLSPRMQSTAEEDVFDAGSAVPPVPCCAPCQHVCERVRDRWTAVVEHRTTHRVVGVLSALVTVGMIAAFIAGVSVGLASWTAAVTLAVLHAALRRVDASAALRFVDFGVLIYLCGMFVVIEAINRTGYPSALADFIFGPLDMASAGGLAVFVVVTVVAVNLLSSTPAVLLLIPIVDGLPAPLRFGYWLALAWASTIGSNMTMAGYVRSIAIDPSSAVDHAGRRRTYLRAILCMRAWLHAAPMHATVDRSVHSQVHNERDCDGRLRAPESVPAHVHGASQVWRAQQLAPPRVR